MARGNVYGRFLWIRPPRATRHQINFVLNQHVTEHSLEAFNSEVKYGILVIPVRNNAHSLTFFWVSLLCMNSESLSSLRTTEPPVSVSAFDFQRINVVFSLIPPATSCARAWTEGPDKRSQNYCDAKNWNWEFPASTQWSKIDHGTTVIVCSHVVHGAVRRCNLLNKPDLYAETPRKYFSVRVQFWICLTFNDWSQRFAGRLAFPFFWISFAQVKNE